MYYVCVCVCVQGDSLQAHVFGLEPHTTYSLRVEAVNGAGSVSSPWAAVRTLEASPSGLANFSVEKREQGRALLLHWDQPDTPNGAIKVGGDRTRIRGRRQETHHGEETGNAS